MGQTSSDVLTGAQLIDGRDVGGSHATAGGAGARFTAIAPRTAIAGATRFAEATMDDVAAAVAVAARVSRDWARTPPRERARLLRAIAHALTVRRAAIVAVADEETGLGTARLNGELDRTTGQLTAFAELLEEGSFVEATISPGDPHAQPLPRPDVRRVLAALGPVLVVTPSNFPLAFGLLGGDTASALAAGCPVVVKGHASHPGTSELCARAWLAAARATGAPVGLLSLLQARGIDVPSALARAPEIQAIAFTGSLRAGRALCDLAAARPQPIPVYAEMGSLNPLFIGEAALTARAAAMAEGLAASITQGTGQFCTKPGLVFVPDSERGAAFAQALATQVSAREPGVLLNPGIRAHLRDQLETTLALPGVERLTPAPVPAPAPAPAPAASSNMSSNASSNTPVNIASNAAPASAAAGATAGAVPSSPSTTPTVVQSAASTAASPDAGAAAGLTAAGTVAMVSADTFLATPALSAEHFGPFALVIRCAPARMADVAAHLDGALTATLHADADDADWASTLCDALADKAGRIVWNGYPTGVAVVSAMNHGGPFPATSNPLHTSVGTAAIRRFLRPVAYQNVPDALLPPALRNANPDGLQRNVAGRWTRDSLGD